MRHFGRPFRRVVRGRRARYYTVRITEPGGREIWRSTHQTSLEAAREVVELWRREELTLRRGPRGFIEAVDLWLMIKRPRMGKGYRAVYGTYRNHWARHFGNRSLQEIDEAALSRYLQLRLGVGLAPRSVRDERSALRSFFQYAVDAGWISRNPARLIPPIAVTKRAPQALAPDQEEALLRAAADAGEPICGIILCLLYSGLRRGTMAQLEWSDVDLDRGEWQIPGRKMKSREDFHGRPLAGPLLAYLAGRTLRRGRIFGRLRRADWDRVAAAAGLSWLRPHDLRRQFVTRLRRAGVGLEVCMWLSDHRDVQTVMDSYRQVDPEEGRQAIDRTFGSAPRSDVRPPDRPAT